VADKAYITPEVLKWARESARISPEEAAKKVAVPAEKLLEWEAGTNQPTIKQAESLANAYKRSFALFFLPEVPVDFQPLQDFRRAASHLTTASLFIIRDIQQKQAWLRETFEDAGEGKLPFVGRFNISSDPQKVAMDILSTLQINPGYYENQNPIREWIDKSEAKGIFISRTSFIHSRLKLNSDELQGFTIADDYAPFVFINTDDWAAPQLFTLVHEIAHIWIAQSGVSNHVEADIKPKDKSHPVEVFCNEVAANALMPSDIMQSIKTVFTSSRNVFNAARKLGISSFALLVRALRMNIISFSEYDILKKEADAEFQSYKAKEEERKAKQKEKEGGPNPYLLKINRNSRLFTQIVIDGFRGGTIAPTQASSLLNTQVNKISKLEAILYK
jgi:Zn-dependent peptidase ImmA (M78 family)/DNA-binding XRE family transcriptional regulator